MRATPSAALLLAALFTACGPELLGEEIGCDWFSGDNCWKASLEAAAGCFHADDDKGVLAADGRSCTFPDGTEISFHETVDLAHLDTMRWDFSITSNGQFCLSFREPDAETRELETVLGTYREEVINSGLQYTCPSGQRYKVLRANNLLSCDDWKSILPGVQVLWSETGLSFSFKGGPQGTTSVFACDLQ